MEFGKTLRAAREARGKSIDEIARETRLMSQIIVDLENENMTRIAAPIYGRGFVKLYCEAVGLEAKPMIDEFMKVYNGDSEPVIRERESYEAPKATEIPFEAAKIDEPPAEASLFDPPAEEEAPQPSLSRYSSPLSERQSFSPSFSVPPIVWRIGAIAIAAILVIWILCKIVGAIYRFSATDPNATPAPAPASHSAVLEEREPVVIPPLYID